MKISRGLTLFVAMLMSLNLLAQFNPDKICRIEDGTLIFTIDPKWSAKEMAELKVIFDLDSLLIAKAIKGEKIIVLNGEQWLSKKTGNNLFELSKTIESELTSNKGTSDLFSVIDQWTKFEGNVVEESAIFGTNNFEIGNSFVYSKGNAWLYLAGNSSAKKVYVSGTFNQWSTSSTPMKKVEKGWTVNLTLDPGKYAYKFIVDGRWMTDPFNKLRENDHEGGYNSVVYCYNHTFKLNGFPGAKKVVVTGNFMNWKTSGLKMNKTPSGWELPLFLRDGSYAYKFLVDNNWMADPDNPDNRKDANGNENSFIGIGQPFLFKLDGYQTAQKVILTGSFNHWNESELVMKKSKAGWELPYVVAAGNYEYKFIVDGNWMTDPVNPFSTGSGKFENSFIALKANHLFELNGFPEAKQVIVTGSFNGWRTADYRMKRQNEKWIFPIYLKPGKHLYKFIVDGKWIVDPANKLFEDNFNNSFNSVLWIEKD
jgi:hypothetical protein